MPDPLLVLLDEARAAEVGGARTRERSLRRQAEEDARLTGVLVDLAERRSAVTLRTSGGHHHGVVVAVGQDFCVLRTDAATDVFVALEAVTTLRPHPGEAHPAASGDRPAPSELRLLDVLGAVAGDRPRVAVVMAGGERVAGELRSVGVDVVTLRLDGGTALCYLSASSVREAVLLRSG